MQTKFEKPKSLKAALGYYTAHLICLWSFRFVFFTLFTHILLTSRVKVQRLDDVFHANIILIYGLATLTFLLLVRSLTPVLNHDFFKLQALNKNNLYSFKEDFSKTAKPCLLAVILTSVVAISGLFTGGLEWLGIYFRLDEVFVLLSTVCLFSLSFFLILYVEERVFEDIPLWLGSVLYVFALSFLFDTSWLEKANLFLFFVVRRFSSQKLLHRVLFGAFFLSTLHLVFGLPYLSQELPRLFFIREKTDFEISEMLASAFGGMRGPFNGWILTLLFLTNAFLSDQKRKRVQKLLNFGTLSD